MSSANPSGRSKTWGPALAVVAFFAVVGLMIPIVASGGGEDTLSNNETFESYAQDYDIANSQGWQHGPAEIAIVTNLPHSGIETPFIDVEDGPAYTNVLYVNGSVSNVYEYTLTNLVYVDIMIKPSVRTEEPELSELGDSPQQYLQVACYVNPLGQLVIYHSYRPSTYVRRWTTIPSPILDTNDWNRLTFTFCYNQSPWMKDAYFMLQINGGAPVENATYAYNLPADNWFGPDNGPWFQTCNSQWFDENLGFTELYGWFRGVEVACQNLPTFIDNLSVTSPPPAGIPITVNDKAAVEGNP